MLYLEGRSHILMGRSNAYFTDSTIFFCWHFKFHVNMYFLTQDIIVLRKTSLIKRKKKIKSPQCGTVTNYCKDIFAFLWNWSPFSTSKFDTSENEYWVYCRFTSNIVENFGRTVKTVVTFLIRHSQDCYIVILFQVDRFCFFFFFFEDLPYLNQGWCISIYQTLLRMP